MSIVEQVNFLPYAVKLTRVYDDSMGISIDLQCGSLQYYCDLITNLHANSLEYYDNGTSNKFLKHVSIKIWSQYINYPAGSFLTENSGNGYSIIDGYYMDIRTVDGTPGAIQNSYRFPAAISHELGHAYSNWCGWVNNTAWGSEWKAFWEKQVSSNHTVDDHTKAPWNIQGQNVNAFEQFANAYRYFFGFTSSSEFYTPGTRSTSGASNGGSDPVISGFEDPAAHLEWKKMLQILPETNAFMATYGCVPGSLQWFGGSTGYYQFQRATDNVYVAQTDYYTWFQWNNGAWQQYNPSYSRT